MRDEAVYTRGHFGIKLYISGASGNRQVRRGRPCARALRPAAQRRASAARTQIKHEQAQVEQIFSIYGVQFESIDVSLDENKDLRPVLLRRHGRRRWAAGATRHSGSLCTGPSSAENRWFVSAAARRCHKCTSTASTAGYAR